MPRIQIDIDADFYSLTGDINALLENRRAKLFLKDYLNSDFTKNDKIIIPFLEEKKESIMNDILELLDKFDIQKTTTAIVDEVLKEYHEENSKFALFSEKAKSIRNNNCDVQDFESFQSIIKTYFKRELYPLQLLSAYHLAYAQNACNFSVPGSGKTSIVYAAYCFLKTQVDSRKNLNKILVVGPLSSFGPWENEYEECFKQKPHVKRLAGHNVQERADYFHSDTPAELTLISYQSLSSSIEDIVYYLKKNNVMIVLDEAHRIKNTKGGIWAKAALYISKYGRSRVILTGTPMPNGYEDLYNLYKFIWPDKNVVGFHLYQLQNMTEIKDDDRVNELIDSISPFFIRIKKSNMILPKVVEHIPIYVKMGEIQKAIYSYLEESYVDYFQRNRSDINIKNTLVRARLIRLMQAAINPSLLTKPLEDFTLDLSDASDMFIGSRETSYNSLETPEFNTGFIDEVNVSNSVDEYRRQPNIETKQVVPENNFIDDTIILNNILNYRSKETPAKFISAYRIISEILDRNEKVIIWTTFVQNILDLKEYLTTQGIESEVLHGGIPVENDNINVGEKTRESIIRDFHNKDSSFKVIIANPFAVGESISLHKACNNAIYLERTFNAGHFIQSKDRIHRYGSDINIPVNYYYILSEDSIDKTIHERLEEKTQRMLEIIEKMPIPLFEENLDYESDYGSDIKALIRDYVERTAI